MILIKLLFGVREISSPGLDDIIHLLQLKSRLIDVILLPLEFPKTFNQPMETSFSTSGPLTHGVLLFGDPGCDKTVITQALAKRCQAAFYSLSPAQFNQKFAGESEK